MRALVAILLCLSCTREVRQEVVLTGETMGGTWNIKIVTTRAKDAAALRADIDALLERVNDQMSTYRPASEISRFNAHASVEPFPVSEALALVVKRSVEIGHATGGAFDITMDPVINLWGFDRDGRRNEPPTSAQIEEAKRHVGLDKIAVEGNTLIKRDPKVSINLGGVASGFAVDAVSDLLASRGFADFMVEITGEVRVRGTNVRGDLWRIGVRRPAVEPTSIVATVPLADMSLTTSGSYHNSFVVGEKRYSHIIDPKTAFPVQTDLVSVTVLYKDALTADAFDTPFLILGEAKARAIIARTGGMEALFIHADEDLKNLRVTKTDGFPLFDE